jgi:hypothetical protein
MKNRRSVIVTYPLNGQEVNDVFGREYPLHIIYPILYEYRYCMYRHVYQYYFDSSSENSFEQDCNFIFSLIKEMEKSNATLVVIVAEKDREQFDNTIGNCLFGFFNSIVALATDIKSLSSKECFLLDSSFQENPSMDLIIHHSPLKLIGWDERPIINIEKQETCSN